MEKSLRLRAGTAVIIILASVFFLIILSADDYYTADSLGFKGKIKSADQTTWVVRYQQNGQYDKIPNETERWEFTDSGKLSFFKDRYQEVLYQYNDKGQITQEIITNSGRQASRNTYTYNSKGLLIEKVTYIDERFFKKFVYTYDDSNELISIYEFNERMKLSYKTIHSYENNKLVEIIYVNKEGLLEKRETWIYEQMQTIKITWDPRGNMQQIIITTYDDKKNLASVSYCYGSINNVIETLLYDPKGTVTSEDWYLAGTKVFSGNWLYDANGGLKERPVRIDQNGAYVYGKELITNDATGNMTEKKTVLGDKILDITTWTYVYY